MSHRLLLIIPSMSNIGGTERMVHLLSALFRDAGFEVHQASFDAPGAPRCFDDGGPYHQLGPVPSLPLLLRPIAYLISAYRLWRLKNQIKPAVTISNLWGADLVNILSGGPGRRIGLCHTAIKGNPTNRLMVRFRWAVAGIYRRFDKVVAVNSFLSDELRDLYGLAADQARWVENFSDSRIEPHKSDDVCPQLIFVWCGRLSPEKNVDGLLAVWARFAASRPGARLVLVGDGPERKSAEEMARSLGCSVALAADDVCSQVVFAGNQSEPARFIGRARCLLLSSRAEGLPMVVLESLALGVPILASDCPSGGVRAALSGMPGYAPTRAHGEVVDAGILLPVPEANQPSTQDPWIDALKLISDDQLTYDALRFGALERAKRFDKRTALDRWTAILREVGVAR